MRKKYRSRPEGLFRSQLEKRVYHILRKQLSNEIQMCINKRGLIPDHKRIELDLYFPELRIGIEIQGPSHTEKSRNILWDYKKKQKFSAIDIDIIYIYSGSTKALRDSIRSCLEILTERKKCLI